jgi:hypothetical protein
VKAENLPTTGPDLLPFARNIIAYLESFFTQNNVALPALRRLVPGQLQLDAWDCEQLAVGCAGITDAAARQGASSVSPRVGTPYSALATRQVTYGIQLVRCVGQCGTVYAPASEEIDTAGEQQLVDMALLSQALVNLASSPPDWAPKDGNAETGNVAPLGPEGGYYAIEGGVTYSVMALAAP